MVRDVNTLWVGLEYFCSEGDKLWSMKDNDLIDFATNDWPVSILLKERRSGRSCYPCAKAYPAYFGSYEHLDSVRRFLNRTAIFFLSGETGCIVTIIRTTPC